MFNCICDCGNNVIVRGGALTSGNTKSCGCYNKDRNRESKMKDLTGQSFGRLTVLQMLPSEANSRIHCRCLCECGNIVDVASTNLKQGKTLSCGCYKNETTPIAHKTHGESHTRLYRVWQGMKERCYNPHHISYHLYGGRGVFVCDEWNNSYFTFKEWAEANGYDCTAQRGACTLDRIDVNGGYEPSNCRWVGMDVQSKNRRNSCKEDSIGKIIGHTQSA